VERRATVELNPPAAVSSALHVERTVADTGAPRVLLELAAVYRQESTVAISVLENRTGEAPIERDVEWLGFRTEIDRHGLEAELEASWRRR
jgi:hypothetical protein